MLQPSFWDNRETADKLVGELKDIKNIITNINIIGNSSYFTCFAISYCYF